MNARPGAPADRSPTGWRVERARPADRGLVARLLETVVADEPSVAPAVADGTLRAAQWLQQVRPDWAGVAVVDDDSGRRVVGYLATAAGPPSDLRVLVHPDHRDDGVQAALAKAAREALATAPPPAPVVVEDDEPPPVLSALQPATAVAATPPATPASSRRLWPERLTVPAGAVAITAAGLAAVLAIEIGSGPLREAFPFLRPYGDLAAPAARTEPRPPAPPAEPSPAAPVPGIRFSPASALATAPDGQGSQPGPGPGAQPGTQPLPGLPGTVEPLDPDRPTDPEPEPGPASTVADPVVTDVADTVDDATGGATTPVTREVRQVADTATDVVDDVLGSSPLP